MQEQPVVFPPSLGSPCLVKPSQRETECLVVNASWWPLSEVARSSQIKPLIILFSMDSHCPPQIPFVALSYTSPSPPCFSWFNIDLILVFHCEIVRTSLAPQLHICVAGEETPIPNQECKEMFGLQKSRVRGLGSTWIFSKDPPGWHHGACCSITESLIPAGCRWDKRCCSAQTLPAEWTPSSNE